MRLAVALAARREWTSGRWHLKQQANRHLWRRQSAQESSVTLTRLNGASTHNTFQDLFQQSSVKTSLKSFLLSA
jgi:hypothetical protein